MNAQELIKLLQNYDPETEILIPAIEGNYNSVTGAEQVQVGYTHAQNPLEGTHHTVQYNNKDAILLTSY